MIDRACLCLLVDGYDVVCPVPSAHAPTLFINFIIPLSSWTSLLIIYAPLLSPLPTKILGTQWYIICSLSPLCCCLFCFFSFDNQQSVDNPDTPEAYVVSTFYQGYWGATQVGSGCLIIIIIFHHLSSLLLIIGRVRFLINRVLCVLFLFHRIFYPNTTNFCFLLLFSSVVPNVSIPSYRPCMYVCSSFAASQICCFGLVCSFMSLIFFGFTYYYIRSCWSHAAGYEPATRKYEMLRGTLHFLSFFLYLFPLYTQTTAVLIWWCERVSIGHQGHAPRVVRCAWSPCESSRHIIIQITWQRWWHVSPGLTAAALLLCFLCGSSVTLRQLTPSTTGTFDLIDSEDNSGKCNVVYVGVDVTEAQKAQLQDYSRTYKARIVYFNAAATANDPEVNARLGISQDFTEPLVSAPFISLASKYIPV